ncbi:enoyl-CoA hydratase/isomerase family protein [Neobacillus sp. MM2021_6]|uniref:enoyl-CoA hydratase/isomerase family protein n=1 Tax=Bacillaceae TaxID=186817 RepID=UPI00140E43BF|nr:MULTISPECIES: enoyl-CoA hydratase/isomerase family protein [Bacillaceae]MBO0959223.1 enoyl-CoA hydratase/isomerase family protein [Neobacillus sp. MM2021_6]NHC16858.1 enoyl-CoA hydratase/isomerase family protein [Bacillus sp. MM2020_4]
MAYTIEKREKGYLLFTITRSEKRNAINYEVMNGLREAVNRASESDIKALIITGDGSQAFCSGGDLSVFHNLHTKEEAYPMLSMMANILYSLLTLPIPTIALINGTVIGGGCELAAACDFRLARKGIKAGFIQGKQAITTGWGGGTILAEKLPTASAMKLLMEAELKEAEDLKKLGFFNDLFETDSLHACEAFMEKMLEIDGSVLQSYKKVWIRKWEQSLLRERIEEEIRNCSVLWESDAHHDYVKSFVSKKTLNKE